MASSSGEAVLKLHPSIIRGALARRQHGKLCWTRRRMRGRAQAKMYVRREEAVVAVAPCSPRRRQEGLAPPRDGLQWQPCIPTPLWKHQPTPRSSSTLSASALVAFSMAARRRCCTGGPLRACRSERTSQRRLSLSTSRAGGRYLRSAFHRSFPTPRI